MSQFTVLRDITGPGSREQRAAQRSLWEHGAPQGMGGEGLCVCKLPRAREETSTGLEETVPGLGVELVPTRQKGNLRGATSAMGHWTEY